MFSAHIIYPYLHFKYIIPASLTKPPTYISQTFRTVHITWDLSSSSRDLSVQNHAAACVTDLESEGVKDKEIIPKTSAPRSDGPIDA